LSLVAPNALASVKASPMPFAEMSLATKLLQYQ
jgi:hypothetical protein